MGSASTRSLTWLGTALVPLLLVAPDAGTDTGDEHLSGRDIYDRVLENRFTSVTQDATLSSADRAGREQVTKLRLHWKNYRDDNGDAPRGILSRTLVRYFHPFDIRHSGYLVIQNAGRRNDQFVYFPQRRKVLRVNLRTEAVFGTDFSFEDIVPREAQDATYRRLEDEYLDDVPVFVVEALPTPIADSEYSRFRMYIEKARYVPLRARYWDEAGVEVKELRVDRESISLFAGVWVPMRLTMRHLLHDSSTSLEVTHLEPNPDLPRATFSLPRLEGH